MQIRDRRFYRIVIVMNFKTTVWHVRDKRNQIGENLQTRNAKNC